MADSIYLEFGNTYLQLLRNTPPTIADTSKRFAGYSYAQTAPSPLSFWVLHHCSWYPGRLLLNDRDFIQARNNRMQGIHWPFRLLAIK